MKKSKKLLSVLLTICMLLSVLPISAYAAATTTALTDGGSLDGNYYLSKDVTLSKDITVDQGKALTLYLNDNILNLNGYRIINNGTLNLYDAVPDSTVISTVRYFMDKDEDGCYEAFAATTSSGAIAVTGGIITGGDASAENSTHGGAVCNFGTFNLYAGNIVGNKLASGNSNSADGGGVYNGGVFNMNGGTITGNLVYGQTNSEADNIGGGVFNNAGATFTLTAGLISYNKATGDGNNNVEGCYGFGGGIGNYGVFIMDGGAITSNKAQANGGGVNNTYENASLTMNAGIINGNYATCGGGIYSAYASCGLFGGTVTGNDCLGFGAGVLTKNNVTVGGDMEITGNTNRNLVLYDAKATVNDDFTGACGVSLFETAYGVFTTNAVDASLKSRFTSDNSAYAVKQEADGKLSLGKYNVTVADVENGTASANKSTAAPGESVSITATPASSDYVAGTISAYKTGDNYTTVSVTNGAFTMPDYDVTVEVEFVERQKYTVTLNTTSNGSVSLSPAQSGNAYFNGTNVVVSAVPASGCFLSSVEVYKTGDSSVKVPVSENMFTMPAYNVTVNATFVKPASGTFAYLKPQYNDIENPAAGIESWELATVTATQFTGALSGNKCILDASSNAGWYYVSGTLDVNTRIEVTGGEAHLILLDGCTLNANAGIQVTGSNSLKIYAQSTGANMGKLIAKAAANGNAGIGGKSNQEGCNITINGGAVTATGNSSGAGIGGGRNKAGYNIVINGGIVTATGKIYGSGIGGGGSGTTPGTGSGITINGGTVTATGDTGGAGIGGGGSVKTSNGTGNGSNITINSGTVIADGGAQGAGIGGGMNGTGSSITINGGTVTATGGNQAAGIGGGQYGAGSDITVDGGTVTATGGKQAAGIGGGIGGSASNIAINGGFVTAGLTDYTLCSLIGYGYEGTTAEGISVKEGLIARIYEDGDITYVSSENTTNWVNELSNDSTQAKNKAVIYKGYEVTTDSAKTESVTDGGYAVTQYRYYAEGQQVEITECTYEGYYESGLNVTETASGNAIALTLQSEEDTTVTVGGQNVNAHINHYVLTMPAKAVSISAGFAEGTKPSSDEIKVNGVSVDNEATLTMGATKTLTAVVSPSNATDKNVTWISSNSEVAMVDNNGTVTALSTGTATITVTTEDGGYTATCTVTVQAPTKDHTVDKEIETDTGISASDSRVQNYVNKNKDNDTTDTIYKFTVREQIPEETPKAAIEEKASGKMVTFFDAKFTRIETVNNIEQEPEVISDTGSTILSFTVPYNMAGKMNLAVYRYHNSEAEELTQVYTTLNATDGTYYVSGTGADTQITIFASKFSAYAAGATPAEITINTDTSYTDAGFYGASHDDSPKTGVMAFSAQIDNISAYEGHIDGFGMYLYGEEGCETINGNAYTDDPDEIANLIANDGWCYTYLDDIEQGDFKKTVYCVPYLIIDGMLCPSSSQPLTCYVDGNTQYYLGKYSPFSDEFAAQNNE